MCGFPPQCAWQNMKNQVVAILLDKVVESVKFAAFVLCLNTQLRQDLLTPLRRGPKAESVIRALDLIFFYILAVDVCDYGLVSDDVRPLPTLVCLPILSLCSTSITNLRVTLQVGRPLTRGKALYTCLKAFDVSSQGSGKKYSFPNSLPLRFSCRDNKAHYQGARILAKRSSSGLFLARSSRTYAGGERKP